MDLFLAVGVFLNVIYTYLTNKRIEREERKLQGILDEWTKHRSQQVKEWESKK